MVRKFVWNGLSNDGEQVILHRFKGNFKVRTDIDEDWINSNRSYLRRACVVDLETTGLSFETDHIIEIGIRAFIYDDRDGCLIKTLESYQGLQDPGISIPPLITEITGLSNDDVKGKSIDWEEVEKIIAISDLIIAHNAAFDRPFLEKKVVLGRNRVWACSLTQIGWEKKGYPSRKLEVLALFHGFFTDAHRALNDVDATLHLLSFTDPQSNKSYLWELTDSLRRPMVRMIAAHSPFESKDSLKQRGYSWDVKNRYWFKKLAKDCVQEEIAWMETSVYRGKFRGTYEEISLERNFSSF